MKNPANENFVTRISYLFKPCCHMPFLFTSARVPAEQSLRVIFVVCPLVCPRSPLRCVCCVVCIARVCAPAHAVCSTSPVRWPFAWSEWCGAQRCPRGCCVCVCGSIADTPLPPLLSQPHDATIHSRRANSHNARRRATPPDGDAIDAAALSHCTAHSTSSILILHPRRAA